MVILKDGLNGLHSSCRAGIPSGNMKFLWSFCGIGQCAEQNKRFFLD